MVREALKAIVEVINTLSKYYEKSETIFLHSGYGGGEGLLYVIDEGIRAKENREKRIESGDYTEEDFGIREV